MRLNKKRLAALAMSAVMAASAVRSRYMLKSSALEMQL